MTTLQNASACAAGPKNTASTAPDNRAQHIIDQYLIALWGSTDIQLAWTPAIERIGELRRHLDAVTAVAPLRLAVDETPIGFPGPGVYAGFELRDPFTDRPVPDLDDPLPYPPAPADLWRVAFGWVTRDTVSGGKVLWWPDVDRRLERWLAGWGMAADLLPDWNSDELVGGGYPAPTGQLIDRELRKVTEPVGRWLTAAGRAVTARTARRNRTPA